MLTHTAAVWRFFFFLSLLLIATAFRKGMCWAQLSEARQLQGFADVMHHVVHSHCGDRNDG